MATSPFDKIHYYPYYYKKYGGEIRENSIEAKYTQVAISKGFLVSFFRTDQKKPSRYFSLFPSIRRFLEWYATLEPNQKAVFEIIRENKPQKMRFDFEVVRESPLTLPKIKKAFEAMIAATVEVFKEKYDVTLSLKKDFIVCDSSSKEKFSRHIILPRYYFSTAAHTRALFKEILARVPLEYRAYTYKGKTKKILDDMVYGSFQHFRITDSGKVEIKTGKVEAKAEVSRHKKILDSWIFRKSRVVSRHELKDTIITWVSAAKKLA
ncbi:hypothetical protein BNJ_00213 [Kaumoebavirus]|uniref:hypothetical protein n=1 Tax=Kaumoebavirus TaxID=1859492 RepID=UPI0009C1C0EC|nr:hypothetical protein BNJ_00213 [Kaumoebavirus]ARA72042.1 hypothetical protein BNJ_00213 [Kaumoebavirus]